MSPTTLISSVTPYGDRAVWVGMGEGKSAHIHAITQHLLRRPLSGLVNVIPAVDNLVLVFDQPIALTDTWLNQLQAELNTIEAASIKPQRHLLSVCYDPSIAPDLSHVITSLGMELNDFITQHASHELTVDVLGFLPGFAYLSGQDGRLNMPRKDTPSLQVPTGSVALGGQHTGIYTLPTPGGWHVVGRTPTRLFEFESEQPKFLLNPMDTVVIHPISLAEYQSTVSQFNP